MRHGFAAIVAIFALGACDSEPDDAPRAVAPATGSTPTAAARGGGPAPSASAAPGPEPTRPTAPLNVLLLTVDSLRADMPWTGYERKIAPNLTKLAERGVVYTHAYAVSSYTAKSVGALLCGCYPESLYRSGWFFTGYSDDNVFLPEILGKHGIASASGHAHMYFGRGKNLDQGFTRWETVPGITFDSETDNFVTSDKMTALAIELLGDEKISGKQFFAWFHYMDPHDKYVTHEESPDFGKNNRDRYDSEVFYTDLHIGKLFDWAEKQPWWKNTVVMLSADHGEAFGEHAFFRHAFWLWEPLVRVPLVIAGPGIEPKRIDERRSHVDIAPTVLDLMGVPERSPSFVGKSLAPEIFGEAPPDKRDVIVLDLPEDSHNPPLRAVIAGDYKIIAYGKHRFELYDIVKDPGEQQDLVKKDPEKFEAMKKIYEDTWAGIPQVDPFGGMKLRSGRVARGPRHAPEPADEPRPAPSASGSVSPVAPPASAPAPSP